MQNGKLQELQKAVKTADRKLVSLYRQNGRGTIKTNTWDLSAETQEGLQAYVYERNARARIVARITGREVYPQMTLDDYKRIAAEMDMKAKDLVANLVAQYGDIVPIGHRGIIWPNM